MDMTAAGIGFATLQAWQALLARYKDSTIEVDTSVMINKADQVTEAILRMERTFDELQRIVSGTNGYWIGEAADGAVALSNSCAAPFTCKKITARPRKYPAVGVKLMYDQTH